MMEKSCFTCHHGYEERGDLSIGIPTHIECGWDPNKAAEEAYEVMEAFVESIDTGDEREIAAACPQYRPKIVTTKCICGKLVSIQMEGWPFYTFNWDYRPCCSQECKERDMKQFYLDMG